MVLNLKFFLTLLVRCSSLFGFITFKYPSTSFKYSVSNTILFIISISFSVYIVSGFILYSTNAQGYTKSVEQYSSHIVQITLIASFTASTFIRIFILLMFFAFSKRIFRVILMIETLDYEVGNMKLFE